MVLEGPQRERGREGGRESKRERERERERERDLTDFEVASKGKDDPVELCLH